MSTQVSEFISTQQPSHHPIPSLYTSLLYTINNLSYRLQKFSFTGLIQHLAVKTHQCGLKPPYFLMGQKIHSFDQCLQAQKQLIFFSYRKNFKLTATMSSDFGWGCLLRVGQMALAQAIRLHFQRNYNHAPKTSIIQPFLDTNNTHSSSSIQKLTNQAKLLWNKNIGQWYSMIQMLSVVQEIHRKEPMKGAQRLVIKIYSQMVDIDQLQSELQDIKQPSQDQNSQMPQSQGEDHGQFTSEEEIDLTKAICKLPKWRGQNKSIMLVVNTKLGDNQVKEAEFSKLLFLMELPIFMGCIAGVQGKARFITGKHGQHLSFFDPHLVQQAQFSELKEEDIETFICKDYLSMTKDNLNPEISVCFFIRNSSDLKLIMRGIDTINQLSQFEQNVKFMSYSNVNELCSSDKGSQFSTKFSLTNSQEIQILDQIEEDALDSSSFTLIQ